MTLTARRRLSALLSFERNLHANLVPSLFFRPIHVLIGASHKLFYVFFRPISSDPQAYRKMGGFAPTRRESFVFERHSDSLGDDAPFLATSDGQKNGEFLTPVSIGGISFANASPNDFPETRQGFIALNVAELIVENLEIIDIEQNKTQ